MENLVFTLQGNVADLEIYDDKLVCIGKQTFQAAAMGRAYTGTKEFYYSDLTSVKYVAPTMFMNGFLAVEFPGSENIETTFWFDRTNKQLASEYEKAYDYIKERIKFYKEQKNAVFVQTSSADELKKFKELLDMGVISQEEFDAKKKQLLGL